MKKTVVCMSLAVLAAAGSTAALAQPRYGYGYGGAAGSDFGPYFGVSAGELLYNEQGLAQMSPTIALLHFGQQFNPYLGIEGRLGTNVSGGSAYGYHINSQVIYAGYIRGTFPINPLFSAYGLLGLGGAQWHRNYPDHDSNDVAVSFGIGAQLNVAGNTALTLEWARLTDGNNAGFGYTADQLTFGVNWRF
ncbi:MAG TPA: porin family protein [Steroidobacteraceae bacterium]|nr:porin family protein [Steroidobacteraceae bacterium]